MDFIPVKIVGKSEDGVIVTPANDKRNCQLEVEEVYRLPKPQEQQIESLKHLEDETDE
jgi:hypothetical protein